MNAPDRAPAPLRWAVILLGLAAVFGVFTTFAGQSYDWDIDHEIYFGQRFLAGELIWTEGFHDKLPFTQIAFAIPAMFDNSLLVFRLASLASVLMGAATLVLVLPRIVDTGALSPSARRWALAFGATLFVALASVQITGLTSVNPIAASFSMIASLLMVWTMGRDDLAGRGLALALFAGTLAAALSISLRPYFIAPTAAMFLCAALWRPGPGLSRRLVRVALVWVFATLLWGLAMNVLGYALTGELQAFRDGLATLMQDLNSRSFIKSLALAALQPRAIVTVVAWFATLALIGSQAGFFRRERDVFRLTGALVCSVLALFAFLSFFRFWGHYFNFFTGYVALGCTLALFGWLQTRDRAGRAIVLVLSATVLTAALVVMALDARQTNGEVAEFAALSAYLDETGHPAEDVLAPTSMYFQWRLHSPIGILPHAANTEHICYGWWQTIAPVASFPLPPTEADYCRLLVAQARPVIVEQVFAGTEPYCDFRSCLLENGYKIDRSILASTGTELRVYVPAE